MSGCIKDAEFNQLICERAQQVQIRQFGKSLGETVRVFGRSVKVTTTPCYLGGYRYWFVCPICKRRCAILYPYSCRVCRNGRYASELLSPRDRKINKAIGLRERLGQKEGGTIAPFPSKPKWMRWHTYQRLRDQGMHLEREIWDEEGRNLDVY